MKKYYLLCLVVFLFNEVRSQSSFRINFNVKDLSGIEIKDLIISNSSTTTAGLNLVIGNFYQKNDGKSKVFLLQLSQSGDVVKSNSLELLNNSISCLKGIVSNNILYIQVETLDNLTAYSYLLAIDLSNLKVNWYTLLNGGSAFRNVKLLKVKDNLFVYYTFNNNKGVLYNQTQKLDLSGNIVETYSLHSFKNINEELVDAIVLNNGKFVVASIGTDSVAKLKYRISLHLLNQEFEVEKSSEFKFFNASNVELNRFGKIELGLNGSNIHLASQEITGRDGHGKITLSMIDTNLTLRTWRNYSGDIVMEDFNIIPGRFLVSGQRPVVNGKEGYAIASINNLNAIPELLSYYTDGFVNSSLATHSFIGTTDSRSLMLVARPNQTSIPYIAFAIQKDSTSNSCHNSFSFNVTKDPLELNEVELLIADSIGFFGIRQLDSVLLTPLIVEKELLCRASSVLDAGYNEFAQYNTIGNQSLVLKLDVSSYKNMIKVYNVEGIEMDLPSNRFSNYHIELNIEKLFAGIYYIVIDQKKIGTFIKY